MDIAGLLPLLFLACPVMMVACLLGMQRIDRSMDVASAHPRSAVETTIPADLTPAEQVALLQQRLDWLQSDQNAVADQLHALALAKTLEQGAPPNASSPLAVPRPSELPPNVTERMARPG